MLPSNFKGSYLYFLSADCRFAGAVFKLNSSLSQFGVHSPHLVYRRHDVNSVAHFHSNRYPITSQTSPMADLRLVGEQLKQLQGKILSQNLCSLLPINQEKVISYLTRCTNLAQQIQKIKSRTKENKNPKKGEGPLFRGVFSASTNKFSSDPQKMASSLLDEAFQIGNSLINMRSTLLSTAAFNYFIYLCQLTDRFGETKQVLKLMSQKKIFPDLSTYRSLLKTCLVFEEVRQIDVYFTSARSYFMKLHVRQVGLNIAVEGLAGIWAYFLHFRLLEPGMTTLSAYATLCGVFVTIRFAGKLILKNYSPYHQTIKGFSALWALGVSFPRNTTQDSMDTLYNQVLLDCVTMGKFHIFRELSLREQELSVSIEGGFAEKAAEMFIKKGELDLALTWIKRVPGKPSPATLFYLTKKLHEQERFLDVIEVWKTYDLGIFRNPPFAIETYARLGHYYSAFQLSKELTLESSEAFSSEDFKQGLCFLESFYFHSYSDQLLISGSNDPRLFVWALQANGYSDLNPLMGIYAQTSVERILHLLNLYSHAFPDFPSNPHIEVFIEAIGSLNSHKRYAVSLGIYYTTIKPYLQSLLKNGTLFSRAHILNQIRKVLFSAIVAGCYLATAHNTPKTPGVDSNGCCHKVYLKENTSQGSGAAFSALLQILEDYKATLRPLEVLPPSVISLVKRAHPSLNLTPDTTHVQSGVIGCTSQLGLQSLLGRLHHISSKSSQNLPKK
ncbi:hypothetical protein DSO57_1036584 [Entomophthora muscae]|uniref:Uncharacterized protein n=1 Tax=Entomophthora muscae TaxID=34485 RepID=A0ACC2TAI5_9FUNG|nr:hypothetical protein DSO57_1036584 [Entomophthora muscae]